MQVQELSYTLNNHLFDLNLKKSKQQVKVSLEVISLENVYTVPVGAFKKEGTYFISNKLVWGDTEEVKSVVKFDIKDKDDVKFINASASMDIPIRSIKVRFDNLPLGKLLTLTNKDTDITEYGMTFKYPEGWRTLSYPFLVFELENKEYLYIRCKDNTVRRKNFFVKKVGNGMHLDIVQECEGTELSNSFVIPEIEVGICKDKQQIYKQQQLYMEKTYDLKPFEISPIVPSWLKEIGLVVIMHMEAFTGHIFHTYSKAYEDIKKITEYIPGNRILVYFAGWEGRYYYKYGNYTPDDRLGGEVALKESIRKIKALGCKTMAMYGINIVNKNIPAISKIYKEAEFETVSGGKFHNGSVNWEGAHDYDFNELVNLNIGCKKWADCLFEQIKMNTLKFDFDGAFLDIAACFVNDRKYSMFKGVCDFSDRLRTIKKDFLVSGEGFYDGLAKAMPLFQCGHTDGWMHYHDRFAENLFTPYVRSFSHLCLGDPSRGSSGVHELGFNTEWKAPYRKGIIPTISLVENSIDEALDKVKEIIDDANKYVEEFL